MASLTVDGERIAFAGELDLRAHDDFLALATTVIDRHANGRLVLDLSEVTLIDSLGLDLLVNIRNAAIESRVSVTVRGAPPPIQDVFALAGLDELFGIPGGRSRRTRATPSDERPKRTALRLLPPLTTP
jgi:anti-anti-sigma factor